MFIDKWKREFDFTLRWNVAEAAARYRLSHGRLVKLWLCGKTTFATSEAKVIEHIMGPGARNYLLRPGQHWGLAAIGMLDQGIIWNQHLDSFRKNRECFQNALRSSELTRGTSLARKATCRWISTFSLQWEEVDMMDAMGELTVRTALPLFFEIDADELGTEELRELRNSIKGYFEAWEFFLLKPSIYRVFDFLRSLLGGPSRCKEAQAKVRRVQMAIDRLLSRIPEEKWSSGIWLPSIRKMSHVDRRQMCIELLLASADTSSVTLYYTLVLLAQRKDLRQELVAEIEASPAGKVIDEASLRSLDKMDSALKESMRLKPVGPMILRTAIAEDAIPLESGELRVARGTHFILNIRDFHVDKEYFPSPSDVSLDRYKDPSQNRLFTPFGRGPKSCVGQHFAMLEMKAILCEVLQRLEFRTKQDLATMETRWDIANHPVAPEAFEVRQTEKFCQGRGEKFRLTSRSSGLPEEQ